ncbi:MAG TPA: single-stranded DNA-binding protein [Treponema sp.]|nr:single-stranded DNA-binding protein [Treponema sp.]
MADVNHVVLIGRLTRDAELKYTSGGLAVCKFAIAVNRRRKSGDQWVEEASFFDIVLFGRSGEAINQYLVKGKQVAIEGELNQNRWEQDGQNRSKVEINASNVQLLGGGGQQGGSNNSAPASQGNPYQRRQESQEPSRMGGESSGPSDFPDDIPF